MWRTTGLLFLNYTLLYIIMTTRHFIIAVLLCCTCLPIAAQDVSFDSFESPIITRSCDLHDLLRSGKTFSKPSKVRKHTEAEETVVNYRDRIKNMPSYLHDFCDQYYEAVHKVLDGGTSWLSDYLNDENVETTGGTYFYLLNEVTDSTDFTFPSNSDGETIKQAALNAAQIYINIEIDSLDSFLPYAFLSVNFDHPEAFWVSNFFRYGYGYNCSYRYRTTEGTGTVIYTVKSMFVLHDNNTRFDIRNNGFLKYDFRSPANIAEKVKAYHSAVKTILEQCKSNSRLRKLRRAHDWLTTHNCYNRYHTMNWGVDQLGGMPWSPLSALEGNANSREAPVCEGYARALKVLCDAMDIPCILMSGDAATSPYNAPTPHMWNYVQMEDGIWYAVDPTWDDPIIDGIVKAVSGKESHDWFLLGSEEGLDDGWSFLDSHPEQWAYTYNNNGSIGWELWDGPELSPLSWVSPDPYDPNGDSVTDLEDIQIMAEKIANDDDNIEDVDGNELITIGDLVRMINRYLSE